MHPPLNATSCVTLFTFLAGTASFLLAMLLHAVRWRIPLSARTTAGLFATFVAWPAAAYLVLFGLGHALQSPGSWFVRAPFHLLFVYVWHLALSAVYIMTYPAIQAESPSLVMMLAVAAKMPEGADMEDICQAFPPQSLLRDRLDDLLADGLLQDSGAGYVLSWKGQLLAAVFTNYRRLLGLPMGEG